MRRVWALFSISVFVFSVFVPLAAASGKTVSPITLALITEIKLGGGDIEFDDGSDDKDFVTIYNMSGSALNLSGWTLQSAKMGFDPANCDEMDWSVYPKGETTELLGAIESGTPTLPLKKQLNDEQAGSLRLVDDAGTVHDLVGWGAEAPCYETEPTLVPENGKSLQRYLKCNQNLPADLGNNRLDFAVDQIPSGGSLADVRPDACGQPIEEKDLSSDCEGIAISEILPNPDGSDTGHEFIELHNSTGSDVSLKSCKLQAGSKTSPMYVFDNVILSAGQYKAFYDSQTGLNLPNAAGGTVWLLSHEDIELHGVDYPGDLDGDVAWASFGDDWKKTYKPTANEENILQATKPCPAGQFRNLETNRCNKSVLARAGLKPCKPNQKRNPATNRCRSTLSVLSVLKPCASDQFRNPETNRCKKLDSASSLKPCKENQERNPETNRCRKKAGVLGAAAGLNEVKDVPAPINSGSIDWWFAGASMLGAISYAAFEWRREIMDGVSNFKSKFGVPAR